jgi:hypothetical protein
MWPVRELGLSPQPIINLQRLNGETAASINSRTIRRLVLAHIRITRSANVQPELIIYDGEEPIALTGISHGRRIIGINTGMIKLIGDDIDELAALLGMKPHTGPSNTRDRGQQDRTPSGPSAQY